MDSTALRTSTLDDLLATAMEAGCSRIGQVAIEQANGRFQLCHIDDVGRTDLVKNSDPTTAMATAVLTDEGVYRPLKTAPNLKHGWQLDLPDLKSLRLALDFFYPAALGNWRALLTASLRPTPLRETVNRQTGMYRITGKITDEQGEALVNTLCRTGCLRNILWPVPADAPLPLIALPTGEIPLLCGEACCLVIAAARKVVKGIPLDQVE